MKTGDGALLTLQTSDTTITDGDVLGALQFQAPNEGDGSDGALVSASIIGEADATFSATVNSTDLVFKLGTDGAVAEKMRLRHEGHLNIVTDGAFLNFGADLDVQLSHVHNVGLLLNSTRRLHFEDDTNLDQYIGSGGSGVLQIASPTEIDITSLRPSGASICPKLLFPHPTIVPSLFKAIECL